MSKDNANMKGRSGTSRTAAGKAGKASGTRGSKGPGTRKLAGAKPAVPGSRSRQAEREDREQHAAQRANDEAVLLHLSGDAAAARAGYRQVLRDHPAHVTTLNNLGFLESQEGNLEEAERLYRQAIALEPERAMPHANLGVLHAQRGDWSNARDELHLAVGLGSGDATVWSNLARVHMACGELDEARACWERALDVQVTPGRLVQLGVVRLAQGDPEDAVAVLEQAVGMDPADADAWTQLGIARMGRHDFGLALDALRRAVLVTPAAHDARHHIGLVHLARGERDEARKAWERLLEADPDHRCRLDLAVLHLGAADAGRARDLAAEAGPGPRRDHYLAVARDMLGEPGSREELERQAAGEGAYAQQTRDYLARRAALAPLEVGP